MEIAKWAMLVKAAGGRYEARFHACLHAPLMVSIYQLKSRFQSLLRPLAACLYHAGVSANQVTIGTCVISLALGAAAIVHPERNYLRKASPVPTMRR